MICKIGLLAAAAALALVAPAAPAFAKAEKSDNGKGKGNTPAPAPAPSPSGCEATYGVVVSSAVDCAGFFDKNIFGGDAAKIGLQNLGLNELGSSLTVVTGNSLVAGVQFGDLTKVTSLSGGDTISFGKTLYGATIIGAHFGNIAGDAQNVSVFWRFDFGSGGATGIELLDTQGFSNAVLYETGALTAVPEPGAWALFTLAFGAVGGAMRTRRRRQATLAA